ncbi:KdsC family phosphatase [Pedobacter glucosidilyticus]|uniref:KdsC family phosphatase n=1 Tax=Pedobacter glucosidilyticus TaxID=1122941 RepID=UPI0004265093|nr:HAD hydrolase family protein [Pedobacter glucosidilyticus]
MLDKLKNINTFIFDVDGVLTNGHVLVTETGEQLRQFNIKDGYALQLAVKKGYNIIVISGAKSSGVEKRLLGLGIKHIFLGVSDKMAVYHQLIKEARLKADDFLYVGDDIPDLAIMKLAPLAVCPSDAVEEIKEAAHYISPKAGGAGVARDIIEKVLKIQQNWFDAQPSAHDGAISR